MQLYSGEHHERGKIWWIILILVAVLIISLSIFFPGSNRVAEEAGWMQIFNTIIVIIFIGAYIWWLHKHDEKVVHLVMEKEYISIGSRKLPLESMAGYVTEVDKKNGLLKNIVFLFFDRSHEIFSVVDHSEGAYKELFTILEKRGVERYDDYQQSFFQILIRKLKL